jgi:HAD superfamily hydrolase (TIGR01490 family)
MASEMDMTSSGNVVGHVNQTSSQESRDQRGELVGPLHGTTSAAFFDLDRTLMSGSSAYYVAKAAYREGFRPLHRLFADAFTTIVFRAFGASDEKSEAVRDAILESVTGKSADDLRSLAPGVIEEILPLIRPEAQALLDMHEAAGRDVYIVSASPVEIVGELARALGIEGGLGTVSEIVDGVYTGQLDGPFMYGDGKAEKIASIAKERGYELQSCYAYSDSGSDLPMMQLVGNPVAVNPDRALQSVAHHRGWPIVEFNAAGKRRRRAAMSGGVGFVAAAGGYVVGRVRTERQLQRLLEQTSGHRWPRRGH